MKRVQRGMSSPTYTAASIGSQNKQGRPLRRVGPAGASESPRYCDTAAAASLIACLNSSMESPNTRTVTRSFF